MELSTSQNTPASFGSRGRVVLVVRLLVLAMPMVILVSGCDIGGGSFPNVAIPATPTASTVGTQAQQSGPAFDLLRQAQQAMQGVTSYHFRLDNSVDDNTKEMNQMEAAGNVPYREQTIYEGDVEPPVARYWPNTDSVFSKMVVVGKDMYQPGGPLGGYHQLGPSGASWYYWITTAGLN